MNISIIGTGYVGLVTGVCLAAKGHKVICADKKASIVNKINNAKSPIYEANLESMLKIAIEKGNLRATTDLSYAVMNSQISIIAVGTPCKDNQIDLSGIKSTTRQIAKILKEKDEYHVVCVKSTVIPKTTDTIIKKIIEEETNKTQEEYGLTMNPEFLREGKAVSDFLYPDRIVIGADDSKSFEHMKEVYEGLFTAPIIKVKLRTAEMIKYTSNCLLAALISFSNEIAAISEQITGIDTKEVLEAVVLDKRINPRINDKPINPEIITYLKAGCGFGGSCFPKDVKALISCAKNLDYTPNLLESIMTINQNQADRVTERLGQELSGLEGRKIAVLGLSYKPETDDIRESPAIAVIKKLLEHKAIVYAADPRAILNAKKAMDKHENLNYRRDYKKALKDAEAVILITPWEEFINIAPEEYIKLMKNPLLFDGRRALDIEKYKAAGVKYIGVGNT